ncbi:MAG: hypothetical protein N2544_16005 [Burkholderiales bacterium]|nr:hypothetical protein [Burkholderiales bacterium]
MIPADLSGVLLNDAAAMYCAGLLFGFEALMQRRGRAPGQTAGESQADALGRGAKGRGSGAAAGFRVAVASCPEAIAEAARLVERRYAWRGYEATEGASAGRGSPRANEVTLLARSDAATLGTLTLRLDGPLGLAAERGYGEAVSAARARGRRVCELTRLALAERCDWRAVLASLFGLAYATGRTAHGVTDVFIEVNPRHVGFYERALGFVVAAGERFCERVKAPSVLLKLELAELERRLGLEPPAGDGFSRPRFAALPA